MPQGVTHVPELVLPMSPVYTERGLGGDLAPAVIKYNRKPKENLALPYFDGH